MSKKKDKKIIAPHHHPELAPSGEEELLNIPITRRVLHKFLKLKSEMLRQVQHDFASGFSEV